MAHFHANAFVHNNSLHHISAEYPTDVGQSYSTPLLNHRFPLRLSSHQASASTPLNPNIVEQEFLSDFREIHSLHNYSDQIPRHSTILEREPLSGSVIENIVYYVPFADRPHPRRTGEQTLEALPAVDPSAPPQVSTPFTAFPPQTPLRPMNAPPYCTRTFNHTHAQVATTPLTVPTAAHLSSETLLATTAPAADHSNRLLTCQFMSGGSVCNATLIGTKRAIRDHLKHHHGFCTIGKDRVPCLWAGCGAALQRENVPRHILSRHLRVGVRCVACSLLLSRPDVQYTHAKVCRVMRQVVNWPDSDVSSTSTR